MLSVVLDWITRTEARPEVACPPSIVDHAARGADEAPCIALRIRGPRDEQDGPALLHGLSHGVLRDLGRGCVRLGSGTRRGCRFHAVHGQNAVSGVHASRLVGEAAEDLAAVEIRRDGGGIGVPGLAHDGYGTLSVNIIPLRQHPAAISGRGSGAERERVPHHEDRVRGGHVLRQRRTDDHGERAHGAGHSSEGVLHIAEVPCSVVRRGKALFGVGAPYGARHGRIVFVPLVFQIRARRLHRKGDAAALGRRHGASQILQDHGSVVGKHGRGKRGYQAYKRQKNGERFQIRSFHVRYSPPAYCSFRCIRRREAPIGFPEGKSPVVFSERPAGNSIAEPILFVIPNRAAPLPAGRT